MNDQKLPIAPRKPGFLSRITGNRFKGMNEDEYRLSAAAGNLSRHIGAIQGTGIATYLECNGQLSNNAEGHVRIFLEWKNTQTDLQTSSPWAQEANRAALKEHISQLPEFNRLAVMVYKASKGKLAVDPVIDIQETGKTSLGFSVAAKDKASFDDGLALLHEAERAIQAGKPLNITAPREDDNFHLFYKDSSL